MNWQCRKMPNTCLSFPDSYICCIIKPCCVVYSAACNEAVRGQMAAFTIPLILLRWTSRGAMSGKDPEIANRHGS